jgi:hypothetical protein
MRPIRLACAALFLALVAPPATAEVVEDRREWVVRRSPQDALGVLTAYEHTCARGCRYTLPGVSRIERVALDRFAHDYLTWTEVHDVRTVRWYSQVTVRQSGDTLILTSRMLSPREAERFVRGHGRPHEPAFDELETSYELTPAPGGGTRVAYRIRAVLSGIVAAFQGTVRRGFASSAAEIGRNLSER